MAGNEQIFPPWDPSNKEGQTPVSEAPDVNSLLTDNIHHIVKLVELTDIFWQRLTECGFAEPDFKGRIMANSTKLGQVLLLVEHLTRGKVYQVHGFLWALVNSGQYDLFDHLSLHFGDYVDETLFLNQSSFFCPACLDQYAKVYVFHTCGHYVCGPCTKGAKFQTKDDRKEDIYCPVPMCGKITEISCLSDGGIGLKQDDSFLEICSIINKREACASCAGSVKASPLWHECQECEGCLCIDCLLKHKTDDSLKQHTVKPKHRVGLCCSLRNEKTKRCLTFEKYLAKEGILKKKEEEEKEEEKEEQEQEQEQEEEEEEDMEEGSEKDDSGDKDSIGQFVQKINRNLLKQSVSETSLRQLKTLTSTKSPDLRTYVNRERQRIKAFIDFWAEHQLHFINNVQFEVDAALAQSIHWQKVMKDITILTKAHPWTLQTSILSVVKEDHGAISEEARDSLKELRAGKLIPEQMKVPIDISQIPGKAKFLAEWIPSSACSAVDMSVTPEGHVLVALLGSNKTVRLEFSSNPPRVTSSEIETKKDPYCVCSGKNGCWAISADDCTLSMFNDGESNPKEYIPFGQSDQQVIGIHIKDEEIYLLPAESDKLYITNRNLKVLRTKSLIENEMKKDTSMETDNDVDDDEEDSGDESLDEDYEEKAYGVQKYQELCRGEDELFESGYKEEEDPLYDSSNESVDRNGDGDNDYDYDDNQYIRYMHITEDGTLVGTDEDNSTLHIVNLNTEEKIVVGEWGKGQGEFCFPRGVCTTPCGHILVCDYANNRICVYTMKGVYMNNIELDKEIELPCSVAVIPRVDDLPILVIGGLKSVKFYLLI